MTQATIPANTSKIEAANVAGKGPRLNNNFTAYYARKIMEQEPDLADVFKTRRLSEPSHLVP